MDVRSPSEHFLNGDKKQNDKIQRDLGVSMLTNHENDKARSRSLVAQWFNYRAPCLGPGTLIQSHEFKYCDVIWRSKLETERVVQGGWKINQFHAFGQITIL